jgi:hypothetical protein
VSASKSDAQQRADRIAAFRAEVEQLQREGVAAFSSADLDRVAAHHEAVLSELARSFDVDRTASQRRMSIGMRIASLLGAAALTAAVVSFAYRVWGVLPTSGQVALLTAAPIVSVLIMLVAGRVEKTRYVASLFAIVACGAFVLQAVMLGQLFNMRGSPHILAVCGLFALAVATPWRFGIPFAIGAIAFAMYVPSLVVWMTGAPWDAFPQRPELLGGSAVAGLWLMPRVVPELATWGRSVLIIIALGVLLVLSSYGRGSFVSENENVVEALYQIGAAAAGAGLIALGLRRGMGELVTIGSIFSGIFLLTRFVDWWWDWMPKYLFFLILAGVALAWLWGLRAVRRRLASEAA